MIRTGWNFAFVRVLAIAVVVLTSVAGEAQKAADVPEANPGRPTVSTPATLPPAGYVQFETGVLIAAESPSFDQQYSLNQVTNLRSRTDSRSSLTASHGRARVLAMDIVPTMAM